MKKALSLAILFTLPVFGAEVTEKACGMNNENEKTCLTYTFNMPDYPYPWLQDFALQTTFEKPNLKAQQVNIEQLVQEKGQSLLPVHSPDSFSIHIWHEIEENGQFIVLYYENSTFTGGMPFESSLYFVFDKDTHQRITIDNILLSLESKKKLATILAEDYASWRSNGDDNLFDEALDQIKGKFSPFPISEYWTFAPNAILFAYSNDQLNFDRLDAVDLKIPVEKLEGIIKPNILKVAQSWH